MPGMRSGIQTYKSLCSNCGKGCNPIGFIVGPDRDLDGNWTDRRGRKRSDVIPNPEMITIPVCNDSDCWKALRKKHTSPFVAMIQARG